MEEALRHFENHHPTKIGPKKTLTVKHGDDEGLFHSPTRATRASFIRHTFLVRVEQITAEGSPFNGFGNTGQRASTTHAGQRGRRSAARNTMGQFLSHGKFVNVTRWITHRQRFYHPPEAENSVYFRGLCKRFMLGFFQKQSVHETYHGCLHTHGKISPQRNLTIPIDGSVG